MKSADNAYKILEIDKSASNDEVKKAYRKMIKKYHPDKLKDVSDDIINMAKQKFQSVKDAYDHIRQQRGF